MTKLSLGDIDIDITANDINKIWQDNAACVMREKSPNLQRHEGDGGNSKWFNQDCRVSRINYLRNKDAFRRNKSYINKNNFIRSSREYKKCMSKAKQQSIKKFEQKLRTLKTTNPKSYWKLLNSNKNKAKKASINDLYEHFKSLNEHSNTISDNIPNDNSIHFQPELDYEFTDEEIRHIAKKLKKNKATGDDNILNEYIYSSVDLFLPVYNYILHTGNVPQDWVIGNIVPIYINKGDPTLPGKYRGFSILSCVCKFLKSIINYRLSNFINNNNILSENPAGFRPGYSTVDHIFTIKNVIDVFLSKRKKYFVLL